VVTTARRGTYMGRNIFIINLHKIQIKKIKQINEIQLPGQKYAGTQKWIKGKDEETTTMMLTLTMTIMTLRVYKSITSVLIMYWNHRGQNKKIKLRRLKSVASWLQWFLLRRHFVWQVDVSPVYRTQCWQDGEFLVLIIYNRDLSKSVTCQPYCIIGASEITNFSENVMSVH